MRNYKKLFLLIVFFLINFFPSYSAPYFRYTGSDSSVDVLNLGFPLFSMIVDINTSPFVFFGPLFPVLILFEMVALVLFSTRKKNKLYLAAIKHLSKNKTTWLLSILSIVFSLLLYAILVR